MEINTNRFSNLAKLQNLETSTPTTSEHSSIWSILLNYLHNEQRTYSLGHYGLRQNDMTSDLWKEIDENADLDHKGIYSFDSVYADIAAASVRAWNESAKQLAPTEWQRENSLWNDSVEWLLRYIY
ncbi:MAG: hypothetical protein LUC37_06795 [Prevotella sp.]|nr:hypothetical protein [Prevotella sp.]